MCLTWRNSTVGHRILLCFLTGEALPCRLLTQKYYKVKSSLCVKLQEYFQMELPLATGGDMATTCGQTQSWLH